MPFTLTRGLRHQCDFLGRENAGLPVSQRIKGQRRLRELAESWEFSLCRH